MNLVFGNYPYTIQTLHVHFLRRVMANSLLFARPYPNFATNYTSFQLKIYTACRNRHDCTNRFRQVHQQTVSILQVFLYIFQCKMKNSPVYKFCLANRIHFVRCFFLCNIFWIIYNTCNTPHISSSIFTPRFTIDCIIIKSLLYKW